VSGRACSVCASADRDRIDELLVAGRSFRAVARSGVEMSREALRRHSRAGHVPARLALARQASEIADADALASKLREIELEARRLGQKAEREGDLRGALQAVRELTRLCELAARLSGELRSERVAVNVNLSPEAAQKMAEVYLARRGQAIEAEAR
jgi:hypothetical protein